MKVKAIAFVSVVLLAAAVLFPGTASAGGLNGDLGVGYYSNFVWRGQNLSGDWVVQPEVNISYHGFGVGLWSNYDSETEEMNRTDYVLNYTGSSDRIGYEVGYIYYRIDEAADTQEFYLSVAHDSLLKPYAAFYWDAQEGSGGFLEVGAGYSHLLSGGTTIDLAADISAVFDNGALGRDESGEEFTGMYNCDLSIGATVPLSGMWSVEALTGYTFALSNDAEWAIEQASVDGESDLVWWGLTLKMVF